FREDAYRLFDKNLLYTPWNKLFLADYIRVHNLYFPDTFWDDFPFCLSVIRDIERVVVSQKPYYHFMRKRAESETTKYRKEMYDKREEEHGWMEDLFAYWQIENPEVSEFLARRYVERLIGCIENVTNASCTLSYKEKRAHIRQIIRSERAQRCLKIAKPRSDYMKIMLLPLKWKSVSLCLMEGAFISRVKKANVKRFVKLKANR
ncbi:MAG: glycosyltransferase family 2 protein, partial [Clostridia bacterium]|nr:glycosyltransferase family 2 protein [Clostridia bacterium]